MTGETWMQYWGRRGGQLGKLRKAELCAMYRALGGLGGKYPPEKWRKDEVITSITEMEWSRLPDAAKLPDPPRLTPACDVQGCGKGENAEPHRFGGDHHYSYTFEPGAEWVPESEEEAKRIEELQRHGQTRAGDSDSGPGDGGTPGDAGGSGTVPEAGGDSGAEGPVAGPELDAVSRDELGRQTVRPDAVRPGGLQ